MKNSKQHKSREVHREKKHPTPFAVQSPFFTKPFAGFAYVERQKAKPRLVGMSDQGVFSRIPL